MLIDEELAAIEARANAANRLIHGNVVVVQDGLCDSLHLIWDEGAPHYVRGTDIRVGALLARTCLAPGSEERAQFYAGAHRDIPALLAHVRELRGVVDRLNELPGEIQNLRCVPANADSHDMYAIGHRDARHAAAELVLKALAAKPEGK